MLGFSKYILRCFFVDILFDLVLAPYAYSSAGGGGGGKPPLLNKFKTCTNDDPTTTIKKKIIKVLLTGYSSTLSSTLPNETFPRFVTFLSNLLLRLRILRGNGYNRI